MSGAVVFIVCLAAALSSMHCLGPFETECGDIFYEKEIGAQKYCYYIHYFSQSVTSQRPIYQNVSTLDDYICRMVNSSTISIRNEVEFEYVKYLYEMTDITKASYPLLIGLTYQDEHFHWHDNTSFNYDKFLGIGYKRRLSELKKGACRRFFLYSPPTSNVREFYTFDINCNAKLEEVFILCRYTLDRRF